MTVKIMEMEVKIDFFFILLILISLMAGLWYELIAAIMALGFHEIGHIAAAQSLGLRVDRIEILPFGGRIKIVNLDEATPEAEMLTVLAGPMVNFAVSIVLSYFLLNQGETILRTVKNFIHYQLIIGFFNMLPALPLDGGRVFVLWLRQYMNYISAIRIAAKITKILALVMFLFAAVGLSKGRFFFNFVIAGFFLWSYAFKEEKEAPLAFLKNIARKKEMLFKKGFLPLELLVAVESATAKQLLYKFDPHKYYIVCLLDRNMKIKNHLTETEIFDKIVQEGLDIRLRDLI
ncbi:MAG: stage sporulation protein [Tepidanaerobacteraceae bacterium]|nr:stage sporulation protein [Tepidanaerobacteraceae bacterium]